MGALLCRELIGRDEPFDAAGEALADAGRGSGRVLFVVGEAGVGKSRLVSEVVGAAHGAGMGVLFGRAVQADVPIPFRVVTFINPAFKDVVAFAVLILVLMFRPEGIFGETLADWKKV